MYNIHQALGPLSLILHRHHIGHPQIQVLQKSATGYNHLIILAVLEHLPQFLQPLDIVGPGLDDPLNIGLVPGAQTLGLVLKRARLDICVDKELFKNGKLIAFHLSVAEPSLVAQHIGKNFQPELMTEP